MDQLRVCKGSTEAADSSSAMVADSCSAVPADSGYVVDLMLQDF